MLALAHHMDDQAETVLMHLIYGSGMAGLSGMRELSGAFWRPLLSVRRTQIRDALTALHQPWREDESNQDTAYTRNHLRARALPALEQANASAVPAICRAADILRQEDGLLNHLAQDALSGACGRGMHRFILLKALTNQEPAMQRRMLRVYAAEAGLALDYEQTERLRALLERYLTEQGFQVRSVANAEQMDRLLTRESFHLMVLDLMLPGEDGLSICRRLRSQSNPMPIIMVTAKGEEVDRIVGLEIGADDYIPKPFNPRELLARIRAVLRRQANELPGAPSQEEAVIAFGKFKLNLGTREMFREDEPMPLTSGEFAVLKALVSHPREPLSRDKLMNLARGREYSAMERSIDVQISRLRRMVEEDPAHPRYIQTVWGLGYVFVPDGSKA